MANKLNTQDLIALLALVLVITLTYNVLTELGQTKTLVYSIISK